MFGLNPFILYGAIAAFVISFASGTTLGYKWEKSNFNQYKQEQAETTRKQEQANQTATDAIRKNKDEQIAAINSKLFDAVSELRKRPSRPATITSNGQSGTGATLYAEDSIFLTGEAARADIIRTALEACYNQYDQVAK